MTSVSGDQGVRQVPPPPNAQTQPTRNRNQNVGGVTAQKAGAYGGSEVGSLIGGAVGPPIIGGMVGNIVGEKFGEQATKETGLDRAFGEVHENASRVFGKRRTDKMGDIALTAFGYSESERCLCCPCMPASQIMFFLMIGFFVFNTYRLVIGIGFEAHCTDASILNKSKVREIFPENEAEVSQNETELFLGIISIDPVTNATTYLESYPCHFGFHYLVSGASVWLAFLPFYICTLFGNCWRQCCCCLCDPVVCCSTIVDFIRRCCCECGRFSCIELIWYSMCIFQVCWAVSASVWLGKTLMDPDEDYKNYDYEDVLIKTIIAAVTLDLLFGGSELIHRIRLHFVRRRAERQNAIQNSGQVEMQSMQQDTTAVNTPTHVHDN